MQGHNAASKSSYQNSRRDLSETEAFKKEVQLYRQQNSRSQVSHKSDNEQRYDLASQGRGQSPNESSAEKGKRIQVQVSKASKSNEALLSE